jgi:CheY-like chemotaxis protein
LTDVLLSAVSILVVDDDATFLEVVCRGLRQAGYEVAGVTDGVKALLAIAAHAPDILITDIVMPEIEGIGLITAVRRDHPKMRIVAMSGQPFMHTLDVLNLAARLGADATLTKPFSMEELTSKLVQLRGPPA